MKFKYIKSIYPKNGSTPYILVEFYKGKEKKMIRIDSIKCLERNEKEIVNYIKTNWNKLDNLVESEGE